ncbi:MAG: DNA-binding protein WhiA [Ruminococcaceae bacterium]|nr:DNA-binding protein WhiA [Oscillospiraceae bacterium]
MSYSSDLKEELIAGAPRSGCCRRNYLRGLFANAGATQEHKIILRLSSAAARHECARVYREQYKKEALIEGNHMLFASEKLFCDLSAGRPQFVCPKCAGNYLRGVAVTCASATDPEKAYRLEFNLADAEHLGYLADFFAERGLEYKQRRRERDHTYYFKKSADIEEILSVLGANNALFALMNAKITHEIRNNANREANCDALNIKKAVDAAERVLTAIDKIRACARFEAMPEELRETARLRTEYGEASLSELAKLHNPPLTKSGLSHRLQRIIRFAEGI